mmetsp:Transcript_15737/g.26265  ORF Transcript_15737/g.26265 Transcript_15737/m.26265 type:complete len:826 (+) Transcript_15737:104-2581(+)
MCKQCLILGALINVGSSDGDVYPCETLAQFDMCYNLTDADLIDEDAFIYLNDTLDHFRRNGIDLVPINVTSDGSCLPHAISRALVGVEIFYDCLRASLVKELSENKAWYKTQHPEGQLLDDESWEEAWNAIVEAAAPTHAARVGVSKFLSGIHVLGMANLLNRPILVLDTYSKLQEHRGGNIDGCGMYLPSRRSREDLLAANNRCLSPIVIGWKSASHDHFVAIVPNTSAEIPSAESSSLWEDVIARMTAKMFNSSYFESLLTLVTANTPTSRDAACHTITTSLKNLKSFVDNPSSNEKYCRLRLENKFIKHDIVSVGGALDLMLAMGFKEILDADDSGIMKRYLEFPTNVATAQLVISACDHDFIIDILSNFTANGSLHGIPYGRSEIKSISLMQELFGQTPVLSDDWAQAVSVYGNGAKAATSCPGSAWCFGTGARGGPLVSSIIERGSKNFNLLERGKFGVWTTNMAVALSDPDVANVVECPVCCSYVQWPHITSVDLLELVPPENMKKCGICLSFGRITWLSVRDTTYLRVLDMVKNAYSNTARLWKCRNASCQVANFHIHERCRLCRSEKPLEKSESMEIDAVDNSATVKRKEISSGCNEMKGQEMSEYRGENVDGDPPTVKRARSVEWICLHCRCDNSMELSKCRVCFAVRDSRPAWFSTLDASEQVVITQGGRGDTTGGGNESTFDTMELVTVDENVTMPPPVTRRVVSAVVHSTYKSIDLPFPTDTENTANEFSLDMSCTAMAVSTNDINNIDIPSISCRGVSAPVTLEEITKARQDLSNLAIGIEKTWFECFTSLIEEVREENDSASTLKLTIKLN